MLKDMLDRRKLLTKYRDQMVKEPNSSWLAPVICKLNEEIDGQTAAIEKAIKDGRASVKDLFLLLDHT
ncbi:MAG TPA: hypothetical protein VK421_06340 [Pyrinomonadaceae bacterium]|nr:hypothetical protein [Pyrinomonadaceae bacterium]